MDSTILLLNDVSWTLILGTICFAIFGIALFSYLDFYKGYTLEKCASLFRRRKTKIDNNGRTISEICSRYGLSRNGFLPQECVKRLPQYYDAWENMAAVLPELNRAGKLQEEVADMEMLSCDKLQDEAILRRAYIILGMLVHSYVNGRKVPWDRIADYSARSGCQKEERLKKSALQKECKFDNVNNDDKENEEKEGTKCTLADSVKNNLTKVEGATESDKVKMEVDNAEENVNDDAEERTEKEGTQGTLGDIAKYNLSKVERTTESDKVKIEHENGLITIPPQLATPWFTICCKLDLPFILTAALDLWNWRVKDSNEPISLSNLTLISSMTGTDTETYFHMVPCAMQMAARRAIPRVFAFYDGFYDKMKKREIRYDSSKMKDTSFKETNAIGENDELGGKDPGVLDEDVKSILDVTALIKLLNEVEAVFEEFKEIAKQIKNLVDKETFYDIYRPLLSGFWPDGIVLDLNGVGKQAAEEFLVKDLEHWTNSDEVINEERSVNGGVDDGKEVATDLKFVESLMTENGISERDCETKLPDASSHKSLKHKKIDNLESNYQGGHENLESNRQAFLSVIKERLSDGKLIVNSKGPSAGQSTMILLFDLLLGIHHVGSGKEFQLEMLNYMPWQHRQMVINFRDLVTRFGSIRDIILKLRHDADYAQIVAAFNACVNAVAAFRALHLGIAVKYLVRAEKGTGSSSFRDMLNVMVQGTRNALI